MGINSYAQNFEDVMLSRALSHVEHGFYIDVGAQDAVIDSVSMAFHERGWQGIHVEPVPSYAQSLKEKRPGDSVVQSVVGKGPPLIVFHEVVDTGLSTADPVIAARHASNGFAVREIIVPCIPLAAVFDLAGGREIHWLKIDVEGFEKEVLTSWAPSTAKPWIVVVESTVPRTQIESHREWEPILFALGYSALYFDGLNRYYLSSEHMDLSGSMAIPPNMFDDFTLNGTASAPFHRRIEAKFAAERADLVAQNEALELKLQESTSELESRLTSIEARCAASQSALELELEELRSRAIESAALAAHREEVANKIQETLDAARRAEEAAKKREQDRLQEFRDTERTLGEWRMALEAAHQRHLAVLEDSARTEKQKAAALQEQMQRDLGATLASRDSLSEALADARIEIHAIENSWRWRLLFAANKRNKSRRGPEARTPTAPPIGPEIPTPLIAATTPGMDDMNENLDPSKPAASIDELLKFNDHDFVQCAYLSVLGRPVDPDGLGTYLAHIRAGADRLDLIRALASSPEGARLDLDRLPGLRQAMQRASDTRSSFVSRRIAGPITRALRPLFARVDVCEYRLGRLELLVLARLDALERSVGGGANSGRVAAIRPERVVAHPERAADLDGLTAHARVIYNQIRDRQREN